MGGECEWELVMARWGMGDGERRWMVVGWRTVLGGGDDGTRRLILSV